MISRLIEVILEVYRRDGKANARSFDSGFPRPPHRAKSTLGGAPPSEKHARRGPGNAREPSSAQDDMMNESKQLCIS